MLKTVLLLNPVYVTLFWAIIFCIYSKKKQLQKYFLGSFMITAFVVYLSHYFYFVQKFDVYYYLDSLYVLAYLLVFPLFHIYVRLLTVDHTLSIKKHGKYVFAPVVLFLLTLTGYLIMGKEEGMAYITSVLPRKSSADGIHVYMISIFIAGRILFLVQAAIFLYLNFRLIKENNIRIQDFYSNLENRELKWVQVVNIAMAFTSISSISLAILGREVFQNHDILLVFPSLIFSVMLFFLGYLGNLQNAVHIEIEAKNEFQEEKNPAISLKNRLIRLFEKDQIFKNADLKIWDICEKLGTNRTYISKIINKEHGKNFCNFVNHYRLEYAKAVMHEHREYTIEDIALLAGFGSSVSFYRAFVATEKITVGEYRRINHIDLPNESELHDLIEKGPAEDNVNSESLSINP